jgi:hypothetical protein
MIEMGEVEDSQLLAELARRMKDLQRLRVEILHCRKVEQHICDLQRRLFPFASWDGPIGAVNLMCAEIEERRKDAPEKGE